MDKIICIGKNYLEHAKELGDEIPEKPVLFLKPPSVAKQAHLNDECLTAAIPANSKGQLHYECELAFKIDSTANLTHVTVALDMTLRDLQSQLKKNGHPWEIAKVFQDSIILGPWIPITEFTNTDDIYFEFILNGTLKQKAKLKEMRMFPMECLSYAAEYFPICNNDVLMSGTPKGVGVITPSDVAELKLSYQNKTYINYKVTWKY